jgi:glucose repression mediator protein
MMDDLQKAYTAYQQALYHLPNPKEPKLWYGIGILYDRYGSLEHAEDAFSSVLRMDPSASSPPSLETENPLLMRSSPLLFPRPTDFEKANEIYFRLGIIYKQQHKYPASLDVRPVGARCLSAQWARSLTSRRFLRPKCFKYILKNPPRPLTDVDIWFQIGHVYEQQKEVGPTTLRQQLLPYEPARLTAVMCPDLSVYLR